MGWRWAVLADLHARGHILPLHKFGEVVRHGVRVRNTDPYSPGTLSKPEARSVCWMRSTSGNRVKMECTEVS